MANEKRLMCVEDFKKNLCHYCNTYMSEEPCEPDECWVCDVIAQTDTVDAVEVPCRCCDCYYLLDSINSFGIYFFCGHRNGLKNLHNTEKDFCPYGKVRYEDDKRKTN